MLIRNVIAYQLKNWWLAQHAIATNITGHLTVEKRRRSSSNSRMLIFNSLLFKSQRDRSLADGYISSATQRSVFFVFITSRFCPCYFRVNFQEQFVFILSLSSRKTDSSDTFIGSRVQTRVSLIQMIQIVVPISCTRFFLFAYLTSSNYSIANTLRFSIILHWLLAWATTLDVNIQFKVDDEKTKYTIIKSLNFSDTLSGSISLCNTHRTSKTVLNFDCD